MKLGIFTLHTRKCSSIYSKTCVFWVKRQQHASSIIFLQWCIAASIRFGTKSTTTTYLHSATRAFICPVRNEKEISIKMLSLLVCWGKRAKMAPSWGSFHFAWIRSVKISRELFLLWNWVSHFWSPETKRRQVKKCRLKDASGGTIDGNWIETPVLKHKSSNAARRYFW